MKRIFGAIGVLLLVVGLLPIQNVAAQNTNNFDITSYDIQYELSRDSESRSVLKTIETITAEFPSYNQNHGLERAIPTNYDGHTVDLKIDAITNGSGEALEYSTDERSGNKILRIGDPDSYVHGLQTYKLEYTQHDVTRFFSDTGRDEWYWDTNGTQWRVPINELKVSVSIDESIVGARVGEQSCYRGVEGSTQTCSLVAGENGSYTMQTANLDSAENVTVAFGFNEGTFAKYEMSLWYILTIVWMAIQFISVPLSLFFIVLFGVLYYRRKLRMKEQNPIVAEYIPPKDASVVVSSQVVTTSAFTFSAQLIDLAVRHFISIVETKPKGTWTAAEYDIVIQSDLSPLHEEEKEIISDMFGRLPVPGDRLALSKLKSDMSYSMRTLDNDKKLKVLLNSTYGISEKSPKASKLFYGWAIALLIFAVLSLSIALGIAALVVWVYGLVLRPLTDRGLQLRRYVLGLSKYIKASEAERLAFLQGPDTAQKVGYYVDMNNQGQIVKLYERSLPYAILFGYEKQWAKRLGDFYQQADTAPDWYVGQGVFNAAVFATTMQSFSQASSYSAGSSSSSGGSSGGGSSGGGGGGGGGGGW